MKKLAMSILLIILLSIFIELLNFTFFNIIKDKFHFASDDNYILQNDKVEFVKRSYNLSLGWKTDYATKYGERPRTKIYSDDLLASFGDSFTHCDEVKDNETWQTYLSDSIGKNVYNFGNSGYGTDQAYLRFTQDYPKVMAKISVLALITANINRVANVYRPFFFPGTWIPATKPYFKTVGNELILNSNPVKNIEDVIKLQDISFLKQIGKDDYWYTHQSFPQLKFPYTAILFNKNFWYQVKLRLEHKTLDDLAPRPSDANLWEDSKYERIMQLIFDKFVSDSKYYNAVPIIMLLPNWNDAEFTYIHKKSTANVTRIIAYCRNNNYLVFDGVGALARNAANINELKSFYSGHLSPLGNQIIAKEFHIFLKNNNLL